MFSLPLDIFLPARLMNRWPYCSLLFPFVTRPDWYHIQSDTKYVSPLLQVDCSVVSVCALWFNSITSRLLVQATVQSDRVCIRVHADVYATLKQLYQQ